MAIAANLGFPRIGPKRELKKALEAFWKGDTSAENMLNVAKTIREKNWHLQQERGITQIPSNDFSLYDQVLDHIQLFDAIPERYANLRDGDPLTLYFAMARGYQSGNVDVVAMEMTKWFDTNYHYIVPEFVPGQSFRLAGDKPIKEFNEAKALGMTTCPVIIGPITFLLLGKMQQSRESVLSLLPALLPAYQALFDKLRACGAQWVQIDEPCLALDLTAEVKQAYQSAYSELDKGSLRFFLNTYFEGLRDNAELAFSLPVDAVHIDLVRAPEQLELVLPWVKDTQQLSCGVIDGRNIWKTDFTRALDQLNIAKQVLGNDRVTIAPSCSLLHSPVDLAVETVLDDEVKQWLAFATQKLDELAVLAQALNDGEASVAAALAENQQAAQARKISTRIHNQAVKTRSDTVEPSMLVRNKPFTQRMVEQTNELGLPLLPTTTIGSFPQTQEVRQARAKFKRGDLTPETYEAFLHQATTQCIRFQETADIDVLVHGEFERNDMVEYFGEQLDGFIFTKFGWVQSYGSRCVKPPIIIGDVSRPEPMTVKWAQYAQSQTDRPMKGMLTGPVTILQWSFVRDDQPRSETCKQLGLAIRDEVLDLETAGIKVIQIDEAALREGLPLRKADWQHYLEWAVDSFRLAASGVKDVTQIHTHMCYSEFNDIIEAVANMDADVISIETSRSAMELLDAFVQFNYPNQIGPGVYDIHSPRVPNQSEMEALLRKALEVLQPEQIWVNPDCGLKTRGWQEVEPALKSMVAAAKALRAEIAEQQAA